MNLLAPSFPNLHLPKFIKAPSKSLTAVMDLRTRMAALSLLLLFSLQSRITVEAASVYFLDSLRHQYLRSPSDLDALSESHTMSPLDVGAALSMLLGSAPTSELSASSSLKLNKVLSPNPFVRPGAVFAIEVTGREDSLEAISDSHFSSALRGELMVDESKADIQIQEEDEVSVISLNDFLMHDSDSTSSDKELSDFASLFGGSYAATNLPLTGEMSIPLASGAHLSLDLSKEADREFITSLVSVIHNVERVIKMHQYLSSNGQKYAELIAGAFDGIKVLQEQYGTDGVAQLGVELLVMTISKIFDSLQEAYEGQIVGVIIYRGTASSESSKLLNVVATSRLSARSLEETEVALNSTAIAEKVFVRRTVAWITGLVLLIATLLGIYFLLNMPLTKDTLLYSNVKLD